MIEGVGDKPTPSLCVIRVLVIAINEKCGNDAKSVTWGITTQIHRMPPLSRLLDIENAIEACELKDRAYLLIEVTHDKSTANTCELLVCR